MFVQVARAVKRKAEEDAEREDSEEGGLRSKRGRGSPRRSEEGEDGGGRSSKRSRKEKDKDKKSSRKWVTSCDVSCLGSLAAGCDVAGRPAGSMGGSPCRSFR